MGQHTVPAKSITAQSSVTVTVPAQNSQVGDAVILTPRVPDSSFNAVVWHAWVSAPDTVSIRFTNVGSVTANTVAQAFDIRVIPNH